MAATQGHGVRDIKSHNKEHDVIDLSILPRESDDVVSFNQGGSTTAAETSSTSTTDDSFRGLHLKDFDVGERLGAKRDGGGGYQGCNSRVFRVRLRRSWQREETGSSGASCGATAKEGEGKEIQFSRGVATSVSPLQIRLGTTIDENNRVFCSRVFHANGCGDGGSGGGGTSRLSSAAGRYDRSNPGAVAGYQTPDRPTENAGVSAAASEPIGLAGRLFRGSFGACFSGHGQISDDELTPPSREKERSGGVSGVRLDQPGETAPKGEFAIKMALTLRGQDPAQVQREMATEIAVLVGGRIPPHENIMRGIHSFQDEIGDDLQPVLWSGLGPRAGEDLNPRTSFLVMPLFTAGSLQALLNKRLGRCAGPPFLRLLDAMRFLEQMLSAVGHLLEHGLAHNDIKPDNWLLTNDQRSLVLTDFGSCVDSLQPLPLPTTSASLPTTSASLPTTSVSLPTTSASLPATSAVTLNPLEQPLIPQTYGAIVGPVIEGSSSSAEGSEYNQGSTRPVYGAYALSGTCSHAATASTSTLTPGGCSAPADHGRGEVDAVAFIGRSPGNVEMVSAGASSTSRTESDDSHAPGASMTLGEDVRQRKAFDGSVCSSSRKKRDLAESLVFPFSDYFSAGAPCFLAPELERAWRERDVLDFRRSDVYSVGVCMYHMLHPGGPETDSRSHVLKKQGTMPHQRESSVVREWPLPIFPDEVGGCPFEVAQLCHGLLQPDPTCRVSASEGHSLARWLVSRLKAAEPLDDVRSIDDTPVAAQGGGDGDGQHPKGGLFEAGHGYRCPGHFGAPCSGGLGLLGKRSRDEGEARVSRKLLCDGFGRGHPEAVMKEGVGEKEGGPTGSLKAAGEAQESRIVDDGLDTRKREGDPDDLIRADRVSQMRFCFARAAPEELFEALQARGWDVQVACDAFGHGGQSPRSNSTRCPIEIDDGDAPAASPWRASKVVPNRPQGGISVDRWPRPPEMLWFNGVAKELRGRIRTAAVSPFRRFEFSHLDHRQPPQY